MHHNNTHVLPYPTLSRSVPSCSAMIERTLDSTLALSCGMDIGYMPDATRKELRLRGHVVVPSAPRSPPPTRPGRWPPPVPDLLLIAAIQHSRSTHHGMAHQALGAHGLRRQARGLHCGKVAPTCQHTATRPRPLPCRHYELRQTLDGAPLQSHSRPRIPCDTPPAHGS